MEVASFHYKFVNSSKTKLYEELGWEPLYKRREKHKLILMYKIINGHTPNYLSFGGIYS
jgi:hypothetical protein